MTPRQTERIKKKVADIKRTLANEKKKLGGYDDSRGLRYLPTKFFIQLQDFQSGLTYTKWFQNNFLDDIGFPDFLFEWTIILFKIFALTHICLTNFSVNKLFLLTNMKIQILTDRNL